MNLDEGTIRLIAVGASVAANCLPCLEHNVNQALLGGLAAEEIADAIKVGRMVRKGAASKLDAFTASLDFTVPAAELAAAGSCCGS